MKHLLAWTALLPTLSFTSMSCADGKSPMAFLSADSTVVEQRDTTRHLTLVFAGDLMQHKPQITAAKSGEGYDYTECFQYIKPQIEYADIAVANFETTLAGPPYSGFPCFSAPDDFLRDVKATGFDVLLTANNHVCDKGKRGIERTIAQMDSLHIPHLGSYVSAQTRAKEYPLLVEKNGFRLVFLNYTYATNGIPVPQGNIVNVIDRQQMARDIQRAKQMQPDVIIAFMHWGVEYALHQNKEQEELADWLFAQGVDHIIGGHPHVVQPMEIRTDANGQKHALAYSLGNFVSNQFKDNTVGGMLVHMSLGKDSTTRMTDCEYSLYYVTRPGGSGHKQHRVYDVNTPDNVLSASERALRDKYVSSTRALFSKYNKNVSERTTSEKNKAQ